MYPSAIAGMFVPSHGRCTLCRCKQKNGVFFVLTLTLSGERLTLKTCLEEEVLLRCSQVFCVILIKLHKKRKPENAQSQICPVL